MREQVGHGSKPMCRLDLWFICLRRENQVGASSQGSHRNAVPCFRAHNDRVVAAAGGSLGKMGHVRFIVWPWQAALVTNPAIWTHCYNQFES